MLAKVRRCVTDLMKLGRNGKCRPEYNWTLGDEAGKSIAGLCRNCFAKGYNTSHNLVDTCCQEIRPDNELSSILQTPDTQLGDKSAVYSADKSFFKEIELLVKSKGVDLTPEQRGLMLLPNTVPAVDCYTWMHWYFTSYGEHVPNCEQKHLDHIECKVI